MTMQRAQFQFIADTIKAAWPCDVPLQNAARVRTAEAFADALAATNPRFDRARFLAACGVE
jgi:hypothetical protein